MRYAPSLLVLSLLATAASAAPIGRVLVAVGEVSAQRNGQTLPLKARAEIELGDLIKTGPASNAQIRLTDGSIIAIKPITEFKFDDYQFTGKQDGTEKGAFSLVKGGFRTITGAIGKQNPQNYKVSTPMANIGIRGTFYNLAICDSGCFNPDGSKAKDGLYGGVVDGTIAVSNQAGVKTFGNDEFFHVVDIKATPQGLIAPPAFVQDKLEGQKQAKKEKEDKAAGKQAEAKPEEQADKAEASGSGFKGDNRVVVVKTIGTIRTEPVIVKKEEYKAVEDQAAVEDVRYVFTDPMYLVHAEGLGHTDDALTEFHGESKFIYDTNGYPSNVLLGTGEKVSISPAVGSELDGRPDTVDNTKVAIFWGRWDAPSTLTVSATDTHTLATGQATHFIGGLPPVTLTPPSGTYSLVGATTGSFSDGNGSATVTSGTIGIDFGQAKLTSISVALSVDRGGYTAVPYTISTTDIALSADKRSFAASGQWTTSSHANNPYVLNCAVGGCVTALSGFVAGTQGDFVGLGYGIRGGLTDANNKQLQLTGVAAFHDPN